MAKSGPISCSKLKLAAAAFEAGNIEVAYRMLAGAVHGTGYAPDFYWVFGQVLLERGEKVNAGRFIFLSGREDARTSWAVNLYLKQNHDPRNFRQLHSTFPMSARAIYRIDRFPKAVEDELVELGFPKNIHNYFVNRASGRPTHRGRSDLEMGE